MGERDPRIDPIPGDVLRKGKTTVEVVHTTCGFAWRVTGSINDAPPMTAWYEQHLPSWRRWAKDAEVLEKANA